MISPHEPLKFEQEDDGRVIGIYRTWQASRNPYKNVPGKQKLGEIRYNERERTFDGPILANLSEEQIARLYDFVVKMSAHFSLPLV